MELQLIARELRAKAGQLIDAAEIIEATLTKDEPAKDEPAEAATAGPPVGWPMGAPAVAAKSAAGGVSTVPAKAAAKSANTSTPKGAPLRTANGYDPDWQNPDGSLKPLSISEARKLTPEQKRLRSNQQQRAYNAKHGTRTRKQSPAPANAAANGHHTNGHSNAGSVADDIEQHARKFREWAAEPTTAQKLRSKIF